MSNPKDSFIFLFLTFLNLAIYAQVTISGKIINHNQKPIENAAIFLNPLNIATTSNSSGEYTFNNIKPGNYTVSVKLLGYKVLKKNIDLKNTNLNLTLVVEEDVLNLESVVVIGTFDPRSSLESSTSISILNQKDIQETYPQGTAGLLQNISGTFTDVSAGEVYTKVYTRGISASAEDDMGWYYVSLQEDGLPVSLIQHSYYSPDLFHRTDLMTERVEAIRGGSSAITALNAPGGIYNFKSRGIHQKFGGKIETSRGFQGANNAMERIDGVLSGSLGKDWFFNIGGHYRRDEGARNNNFKFSKGGQLKFNIIKKSNKGNLKFYGKYLNDFTNRHTGVAATNWNNPTAAFGQNFRNSSLLMPSFNATIPDGRNLTNNSKIAFNPTQGVHAKDIAFGLDFSRNFENNWSIKNNLKFSSKKANWQTSISNAFVSLSNPLAYFISGAQFPIGQVIFNDANSGVELARVNNADILSNLPFQYISGSLPNDAIMGTSAWYKDNTADEWMNQLVIRKKTEKHDINFGTSLGFSNTSHFTTGSFAFVSYEPNPKMLSVRIENPGQPTLSLSDSNGVSNYGGLFFVNAEAKVGQMATFANDRWSISDKIHLDLGLRYETINHKGNKDRFAPFSQNGGIDGDPSTAYDNGVLASTGNKDHFDYNYNYLSYSAAINYRFDENTALFARFSKGNKAPELNYYFNNFSNVPINQKGTIQKIIQTEIGAKLNAKQFAFTGTSFWSKLKDVGITNFEFDDSNNSIFYTPILFNSSDTYGFEWESVYTPINYWEFSFNGVIQNPKATNWKIYDAAGTADTSDDSMIDYSGNVLPFNPKLMFNLGTRFQKNKVSSFLKWQYLGKRQGNVANGFELASYSVFNLGAGYRINKNLSTNLIVTNLFNSDGLANFFGANNFGANANGATPEFIKANPDTSFVVFPILRRRFLLKLNYTF